MRYLKAIIIGVAILLLIPSRVVANIYINEISSATDPEWVELYNASDDDVNLDGWFLKDSTNKSLPLSATISAKGFAYFEYPQGKYWLNNAVDPKLGYADIVSLYNDASPSAVDSVKFGTWEKNKTLGRIPNGGDTFMVLNPSQGTANQEPLTLTPTPTASPTVTPTPTSTPTVAQTQTPTPTPTNTPTPTPQKTSTPTPTKTSTPTKTLTPTLTAVPAASGSSESATPLVLGENIDIDSQSASHPAAIEKDDPLKKQKVIGGIAILGGFLLMGGTVTLALAKFR